MSDNTPKTKELLEEERRQEMERRKRISTAALQVEQIFLKEQMTMGEVLEVFSLLTERANQVLSLTPLQKIKDDFDKLI